MASISGNIPVELVQLVNLKELILYENKLTGALWYVPSYHTTNWLLNSASISGSIPVELGQLVNLNSLDLSANKLTGALWYVPSHHTTNWLLIWLLLRMLTLQVPDGAPTGSGGDMHYTNREKVAAFQACLK